MIRLTPSVSHIGAGLGEPDGKEIQAFNYITFGEESQKTPFLLKIAQLLAGHFYMLFLVLRLENS